MITQHLAWNDTVRIRYLRQAFALSRTGTAKRTPVHLLGRACFDRRERTDTAKRGVRHGNAMGMPCIIIELRGIALQVLENAKVTAMQVLWEGYGLS